VAKPYDATGKELLELAPAGWLELVGVHRPPEAVTVVDADVSAVTAAADKVLRIADESPWLAHVEFQTGRDAFLPGRLRLYNAALHARHQLPVATVVVLLRPDADDSALTGEYRMAPPVGPASTFGYRVIRVWQLPVESLLTGPVVLTPLAAVATKSRADVRDVVDRMSRRLYAELDPAAFEKLARATMYLLTMRYDAMTAKSAFADHPAMKEVYELIKDDGRAEGRANEARSLILRMGRKRFGPPRPEHEAALAKEADIPRLEALGERLLDVATWEELFAE
jgi:hypothetical protein